VAEFDERAPKSIYQHQQSHTQTPSPTPPANGVNQQRYFRIPFTKDGQNKGLWYAHFDGQYIARQMEIHPGKPQVLMVAGRDDMNMCELKLSETGLTKKRGAEILEYDFEKEWDKNGGEPYIKPAERPERGVGNLI
jgi:myosin-6